MMNDKQFSALAAFLKANSGLVIGRDKTYLVISRLESVAEQNGFASIDDLVRQVTGFSATPALKREVIEAMTTNETSFFRDETPFENFRKYVLPSLLAARMARRRLRILCAAASSGQEPYSIAMLLAENKDKLEGWCVEIVGIDINRKILKRAEEAVYTQFEVQRGLPIKMLMKHFDREAKSWRLKPDIRQMVRFRECNLLQPLNDLGQFDVIFCRNVLIYFDADTKRGVLDRLHRQIASDGYLFLGGAESVIDITDRFAVSVGQRGMFRPVCAETSARAAG